MLPDENSVSDKSFPEYWTTPDQGISQDMLFYCCHEYVGIIWDKVSPHCSVLKEVKTISITQLF